jgi:recombination associated protein RdgC
MTMQTEFLEEGLRFLQTNRAFVGREFLTWLWFLSETQGHRVRLPDVGEFRFFVDDRIVLTSPGGSVHENVLKGGTPAYATEAKVSLLSGKLVNEAKFVLQEAERQWSWSMRADDLGLRGVKLPPVSEPDAAAHMAARLRMMQTLVDVIDGLFRQFMELRVSPAFEQELDRVASWLAAKEGA